MDAPRLADPSSAGPPRGCCESARWPRLVVLRRLLRSAQSVAAFMGRRLSREAGKGGGFSVMSTAGQRADGLYLGLLPGLRAGGGRKAGEFPGDYLIWPACARRRRWCGSAT